MSGAITTSAADRPGIDPARLAHKGSVILTEWRAGRQRERAAQAAQAELRQAMSTLRRSQGLVRAPHSSKPAEVAQAAFQVIDGQRAFGAAETDRLAANWTSSNTGINADLERALPTLRARSRDWAVNTDIGRRYIDLVKDNLAARYAPGQVATPSGAEAIRSASAGLPNNLGALPAVYVLPDAGTFRQGNGSRFGSAEWMVRLYYDQLGAGDLERDTLELLDYATNMVDVLRTDSDLGGSVLIARTVGWRIGRMTYAGADYT